MGGELDEVLKREASFWAKVERGCADECWPWLASTFKEATSSLPYGRFYIGKSRVLRAHRAAWMLAHRQHPSDRLVCHSCDNPKCCNPAHLWLGSYADNNADRAGKGRNGRVQLTHENRSQRGERHGAAVLTDEQVQAIRRRSASGESLRVLANDFGVHRGTIHRIVRRKIWTHI